MCFSFVLFFASFIICLLAELLEPDSPSFFIHNSRFRFEIFWMACVWQIQTNYELPPFHDEGPFHEQPKDRNLNIMIWRHVFLILH